MGFDWYPLFAATGGAFQVCNLIIPFAVSGGSTHHFLLLMVVLSHTAMRIPT